MRSPLGFTVCCFAIVAACGADKRLVLDGASATTATATPSADAAIASPIADELFAGVPADTAYVVAIREPIAPEVWARLAYDISPFLQRLAAIAGGRLAEVGNTDPSERFATALVAELPGPIDASSRVVLHELRGAPVLRLEVEDEAALAASVTRAATRAHVPFLTAGVWLAEGAGGAVAVVVRGRRVALTTGAVADVRAILPVLTGDEALGVPSLDPAAAPAFGAALDLRQVVRLAGKGDACDQAGTELLAQLAGVVPRLTLDVRTLTDQRIELVGGGAVAPAIAAMLHDATVVTPGVPATFPGHPFLAASFAASSSVSDDALSSLWAGPILRVAVACNAGLQVDAVPSGAHLRAAAFAYYGADTSGWFPTDLQAYVALVARDAPVLEKSLGGFLHSEGLDFFVRQRKLVRRGDAVMMSVGRTGVARARAALAATEAPPLLHVFVDVAHFAASDPAEEEDKRSISQVGGGLADEAGLGDVLARVVSTLDVAFDGALHVTATIAPRATPAASTTPSPRRGAIAACDRLMDRIWASEKRALARFGVTTGLDEIEDRVRHGTESATYAFSCVDDLSADARQCLLAAPDPLAVLLDCGAYGLELPRMFDEYSKDPDPIEQRLAAGAPTLAQLAGTWSDDHDDTWTIAASGKATYASGSSRQRYTLSIESNGSVRETSPDGAWSVDGLVLAGDELYLGGVGVAYPMSAPGQFLVGHRDTWDDTWIIPDGADCFQLDGRGRNRTIPCRFTGDTLEVAGDTFQLLHGYLVSWQLASRRYHRVP